MIKRDYTWKQKARAKMFGRAKLQLRQPPTFKQPTMFYLGCCKEHGYFEDYLHRFEGEEYLSCPKCAVSGTLR